jgi:3-hydroxyacyl-[acyl-carrier-protein] dehydratase
MTDGNGSIAGHPRAVEGNPGGMTAVKAAAIQPERTPRTLGFTELKTWLRHRHPMVMLDRVTDYEPGRFLNARLAVSGSLDFVAGHFPERAVFPGSHLIQALSQAAIILFQLSTSKLLDDELTLISSVEARFFKVIVPGDLVELRITVERLVGDLLKVTGRAEVEGVRSAAMRATLVRTKVAALGTPQW